MNLVKITITDRRGEALTTPVAMGFDVNDIVSPIKFNSTESKSYFATRAIKDSDNIRRNIANIDYKSSDALADIKALSGQLLLLTVVSRRGVTVNSEEMIFVNSKISETLKTVSAGTSFFYMEEGDPLPVEYIVEESIDDIIAQQPETPAVPPNSIPTFIIEATWEGIDALKTANNLEKGSFYKITDRFNYQSGATGAVPNPTFWGDDRGFVYLQALETNKLSKEAIRVMACPKYYNQSLTPPDGVPQYLGIWNSNLPVFDSGAITIWGASVWQSQTAVLGTHIDDFHLDPPHWIKISKNGGTVGDIIPQSPYEDKQFSVIYDFDNDWFEKQWDGNGNEVGADFQSMVTINGYTFNPCDITDWNFVAGRENVNKMYNNIVSSGIYNNVCIEIVGNKSEYIKNNICGNILDNIVSYINDNNITSYDIKRNICNSILLNTNIGQISYNDCINIESNSNNGMIRLNKGVYSITENSNNGTIFSNRNTGDVSLNTNGGNIDYNTNNGSIISNNNTSDISYNSENKYFDVIQSITNSFTTMKYNSLSNGSDNGITSIITGLGSMDFGTLSQFIDRINLSSTNATETLTDLIALARPTNFYPESGLTVTFDIGGNLKLEGGVAAIINGTNEDFIQFDKSKVGAGANMINGGNY